MIDELLNNKREKDLELLRKTTKATLMLGKNMEVVATEIRLPILHTNESCVIDDLVRIEVMEGSKVKGWLYQKVHAITFPHGKKRILIRRTILEDMVHKGCSARTFVEEPTLFGLQKLEGGRTVAYLSLKDVSFAADISY